MVITTESNVKYQIHWSHYNENKPIDVADGTTCEIKQLNPDTQTFRHTIGFGKAIVSEHDNFNKNRGRKISLARALQVAGLSKEDKKLVWNQYNEMRNNKW